MENNAPQKSNGKAVASLVLGIIAVVITAITFFTCGLCVICAAGAADAFNSAFGIALPAFML